MDSSPVNRWRVLAVVCAALMIVVIDMTVLHIAAPSITESLHLGAVELLWVIDVYPLVVAPLLVPAGTLGDRIGHKRVMVAGMGVFLVASALAAFAPSGSVLIGARALQGVGGALIMPATMAVLRDVFPDREERVRAVGIWSAVLAAGAAIGPLVGGFLVEHLWWGSVFLINVPVILLVLPFALRWLPESRSASPPPWDVPSVVFAALAVLGLAFGIKEGAREGFFAPVALVPLVGGVLMIVAFARRNRRLPVPLLELDLFRTRQFSVAVASVLLSMFALVGLELFFAQYLQLVLGLEPFAASLRLLPLTLATLAGGLLAARVLRRLGTRAVLAGGLGVAGAALVPLLWLGVSAEYLLMWPSFVAMGFALEVALVAANDAIISAASADRVGGAAAIEDAAYELGGGLGVVVLGSIVGAVYASSLGAVTGVGADAMRTARESLGRVGDATAGLPADVAAALEHAARAAFMDGFHAALAVSLALLAGGAVTASIVLRPRVRETVGRT